MLSDIYTANINSVRTLMSVNNIEPTSSADITKTKLAQKILLRLFPYRRLFSDSESCTETPCEKCLSLHSSKVLQFVRNDEPIHFLLPAFPAKSPNQKKVLGHLPDMAEELALRFLQNICDEIKSIYKHGAKITICSDGRVFSHVVGVSDKNVSEYGQAIKHLIENIAARSIETFSMDNLFQLKNYDAMREQLISLYADSIQAIKSRVKLYEEHRSLFNGIHRFLFEDSIAIETFKSRNRVRNESKQSAYKVIQRSDAWSKLIKDCFPNALRLSIHPQHPHSEKIGIQLGNTNDNWLTPWHSVALKHNGVFMFVRRHEAEGLGATLVKRNGRMSHYQIG